MTLRSARYAYRTLLLAVANGEIGFVWHFFFHLEIVKFWNSMFGG